MSAPNPAPAERASPYNARLGMILFVIYLLFYLGYVLLSAFAPATMAEPFVAGLNAAVVYGLALIVVALVLALLYSWMCETTAEPEKENLGDS